MSAPRLMTADIIAHAKRIHAAAHPDLTLGIVASSDMECVVDTLCDAINDRLEKLEARMLANAVIVRAAERERVLLILLDEGVINELIADQIREGIE